jgi:hypothetical protein
MISIVLLYFLQRIYTRTRNNTGMQLMHPKNAISLKTIAISTKNYQILKNMGKAADSFNVITLVKKGRYLRSMNNENYYSLIRALEKHNQTVVHPERHNVPGGVFNE